MNNLTRRSGNSAHAIIKASSALLYLYIVNRIFLSDEIFGARGS